MGNKMYFCWVLRSVHGMRCTDVSANVSANGIYVGTNGAHTNDSCTVGTNTNDSCNAVINTNIKVGTNDTSSFSINTNISVGHDCC